MGHWLSCFLLTSLWWERWHVAHFPQLIGFVVGCLPQLSEEGLGYQSYLLGGRRCTTLAGFVNGNLPGANQKARQLSQQPPRWWALCPSYWLLRVWLKILGLMNLVWLVWELSGLTAFRFWKFAATFIVLHVISNDSNDFCSLLILQNENCFAKVVH